MITANIATYPKRLGIITKMLDSIIGQFDEIRIYYNGDYHGLLNHYPVTVVSGEDLGALGKFYFLPKESDKSEYYFTLDDDLIYNDDYVNNIMNTEGLTISNTGFSGIVSHHGRRLVSEDRNYFTGHENYHCLHEVDKYQTVDVPGTGCMAFHTDSITLPELDLDFKYMADLWVGLQAAKQKIPITVLPHSKDYFVYLKPEETIYNSHPELSKRRMEVANEIYRLNYG